MTGLKITGVGLYEEKEKKPNTGSRTEVEKMSNKQMNGIMPTGKLQSSNCKSLQRKLIWQVITLCPWGWKVRQLEWKGLKQLKNEIYLRRYSEIEIFFQRVFMYFNQHQAFLNWKWTWSLEIISSNQHRSHMNKVKERCSWFVEDYTQSWPIVASAVLSRIFWFKWGAK